MQQAKEICAKIRNIFSTGELRRRYGDGRVQVATHNGRAVEKKEAFPYGFSAKAKSGRAFVICQGGNLDGFEILPVMPGEGVEPPALEENDVALYTEKGGWIVCREAGKVELFGKDFGEIIKAAELQGQLAKLTARVDGIMEALKNSPTAPNDGGSSYKGGIAGILAGLTN